MLFALGNLGDRRSSVCSEETLCYDVDHGIAVDGAAQQALQLLTTGSPQAG
jgi:hypothetical protein